MSITESPMPGERWLAKLQLVDAAENDARTVGVKLVDFDPHTKTWSVAEKEGQPTMAILAEHLLERLDD